MLADKPTQLHSLSVATNFLDLCLLSAIGKLGKQGVLRHLTLATGGTNLKADGIKEIMSSCVGLESFVLNDVEGESGRDLSDSRSAGQAYLENGGRLASQLEKD
jgi:hypothetical protein